MPEDELRRPMSLHAEISPLPNFKPIENVEKSKKDVRASSITCLDELDQVGLLGRGEFFLFVSTFAILIIFEVPQPRPPGISRSKCIALFINI